MPWFVSDRKASVSPVISPVRSLRLANATTVILDEGYMLSCCPGVSRASERWKS